MLDIKPTEHLTGVTISGDYETLYQLVEAKSSDRCALSEGFLSC